jgi:tetratricopeptide (TPR) repeat protein
VPTLLAQIKRCDLYDIDEDEARERIKAFLTPADKPSTKTRFPGGKRSNPEMSRPRPTPFPGMGRERSCIALSNIPIVVPIHFLGRDRDFAAIDAVLSDGKARAALHGMRGVGKTTLAAAYADRHRGDYRATWWIRAQTEPTMRADLVGLGVRLGWVAADEKEEPALTNVMGRLRDEGEGVLLIYDNATNSNTLKPYLPPTGTAHVLVTSNDHAWRGVAEPVEIRVWRKDIGADYLIVRTGRNAERDAAEVLSDALGGLPLAHEQAAAYCEDLGIDLAEYHRRFEAAAIALLDQKEYAPVEYHPEYAVDHRDRLTVAGTFRLAIERAAERHFAAEPLIVHAALLAPEPIPLFLFAEAWVAFEEPLRSGLAGDGLDKAVAALRAFALVDREMIVDERDPTITTTSIRLHGLVRRVAATCREGETRTAMLRTLIEAVAMVYPKNIRRDPHTWPRVRRLDALALGLVDGDVPPGAEQRTGDLLDYSGEYRYSLAAYAQAKLLYERALAIREKVLGSDHPDTAMSLNNLAELLRQQGDLKGARPLFERALAINEKVLGPEHPATATSVNNFALLLEQQDDVAGARTFYERALAIRQRVLGTDHPNTAASLNNLAELLRKQGDPDAAQPLSERALAIYEKVLGPEHPDTARAVNNLAMLFWDKGDVARARPLFERALAIREKLLGEHPDTAINLSNVAFVLREQGDVAGARPLFERALAIREKLLGSDHPDTISLKKAASLFQDQGDG